MPMNRWKMHKLGFLNFWLYDQEEFLIQNGHLLLRGDNASGKSITTQSFIPFILDGNKSPERLDPFGSRDRKMEFYLLGDGEQEESTGYLYLEFKKEDTEEYLTIGIGMRAQKESTSGASACAMDAGSAPAAYHCVKKSGRRCFR